MDIKKHLLVLIVAMSFMTGVTAQKYKPVDKLYAFGVAASFNDSVVYITDIQEVDSAWMYSKSEFLVSRNNYSNQLRDYLANNKHEENRTCITCYAYDRKKIEKKYIKMKGKYTKKGDFDVRYLTSDDFRFQPVAPYDINEADDTDDSKAARKAAKKAAKQKAKQKKASPKDQ